MSTMTSADSTRRVRSRWFDPRLAVGIGLVLASVAGVVAIVSAADRTITVYAAGSTLAAGEQIAASDLVETRVRLGALVESYLVPGDIPAEGIVVVRTVGDGELVPASAAGSLESLRAASIVVSIPGLLPRSIDEGAVVDLWAATRAEGGEFEVPGVVANAVSVVRVVAQEGVIAGGAATTVELLVPRDRIARLLEAKASGDTLSLVPASLPVKG